MSSQPDQQRNREEHQKQNEQHLRDIGSAGGHRAMAKAVIPLDRFKEKFGEVSEKVIREAMLSIIAERDQQAPHE